MHNKLILAIAAIVALFLVGYFYLSSASLGSVAEDAKQTAVYQEFLAAYPNAAFYQVGSGDYAALTLSSGQAKLILDFSLKAQGWKLDRMNFTCAESEVKSSTSYGFEPNVTGTQEVINAIRRRDCR